MIVKAAADRTQFAQVFRTFLQCTMQIIWSHCKDVILTFRSCSSGTMYTTFFSQCGAYRSAATCSLLRVKHVGFANGNGLVGI